MKKSALLLTLALGVLVSSVMAQNQGASSSRVASQRHAAKSTSSKVLKDGLKNGLKNGLKHGLKDGLKNGERK